MSVASLATTAVQAEGAKPTRTAWFVHGILGAGRNWRSFCGAFVAAHPEFRVLLVDLRHHGDTGPAPGPNTLEACAADLALLAQTHGAPELVAGHSFGGKSVMTWAKLHAPLTLEQLWVLDAAPSAMNEQPNVLTNEVLAVVGALARSPVPADSRNDVIRWLEGEGFSQSLARWLATNLIRQGEQWVWRMELPAIQELLNSYYDADLVPWLREPHHFEVHLVRAGRSDRWSAETLAALEDAAPEAQVQLHTLVNAGHWLHVDDPAGLAALFDEALSE